MAARCDGLAGHPVGISRSGLLVAFAGSLNSYALLLLFGFFLGLAGTTFAVGIPFVNAWFERARRGLRLEFSVPAWAALRCLLFTPRLVRSIGCVPTHVLTAIALVVVAKQLRLIYSDLA